MKVKKVLVTGGAGFIGGNFIHYLMNKYPDYEIHNLDALTYAGELSKHNIVNSSVNYRFILGDIADQRMIFDLFEKEKYDFVVHFAAESHVDRSITDPGIFIRTNVLGTGVLLDAMKKFGIKRYVHVSTDEVYGELSLEGDDLFLEETPLRPNSPYSASKASSDMLVQAYFRTYDLPAIITRCSNNYGPYQYPEKLIPLTIRKILQKEPIPVYGDGGNVRDWLHVKDHCSAIDIVLHNGVIGEVYNIGGRNERRNIDVVHTIINCLKEYEAVVEYVNDRPGHDKRYAINPAKIEALGWKPKFSFESGIEQTVQWYCENANWLIDKDIYNEKK